MNLIRLAIGKPVSVLVGVILVVLFGVVSVLGLPVQLTPTVDQPIISVNTLWEGASPQEIERDVVNEQEERLKGIQGLRKMSSTSQRGAGSIELEFAVGQDSSRALLETSEKLRQVPNYPENVQQPVVAAGETRGANAIAWFILRRTPDSKVRPDDIIRFRTLLDEEVKPRLERAKGVAQIGIFGGVDREVQIRVDPFKLASRRLTMLNVRDAIRRHNVDVSAGDLEVGRRASRVRTVGKFRSADAINGLVIARRGGQSVYLRDVGHASFGYKDQRRIVRANGEPAIAMNATRTSGSNVIEVMKGLQAAVAEVNRDLLAKQGLRLEQAYDQTEYIYSAIDLVVQNLWVGGLLAVLVLLVFLREGRSTLVVAVAIPISVIGAFLGLAALGRNLNVVSLAGLAFAVGMVVDNSIVVLENIDRHRQLGKPPFTAALDGTREVWGAVLASTLTTLAVFIPVVFVQEEAGQLFRDIAIAISAAVFMSLLVSVLFIPMVSARLASRASAQQAHGLFGLVAFGTWVTHTIASTVAWINRSVVRAALTVLVTTVLAVAGSILLVPPTSYLPDGNQNLVFGFMITPPGWSRAEFVRIAKTIESRLAPYWSVKPGEKPSPSLQRPAWYHGEGTVPGIENFFYVALESVAFLGARSREGDNIKPLIDLLQHAAADIPDIMVFAQQTSLFARGLSTSNSIDLEVSGFDIGELEHAAGALTGAILPKLGYPRPDPANFQLGVPEVQVAIDEARAADLGLGVRDLGFIVRSMVDGAKVSELRDAGTTLDVKLMPSFEKERPWQELAELPIFTPAGRQVPLAAIAKLTPTTSPNEIKHIEERRAIKLIVTPPRGMDLSTAMHTLEDDIIPKARKSGAVGESVSTFLSGTADKLVATRQSMQWNLLLALAITYLLLSALFESFLYPFVILFSVPLAAVGGVVGLKLVHLWSGQRLDVLTMLGFVILIGTVVNNAILIVHQALQNMRIGGDRLQEALRSSVATRIRPIFMSTSTSVLGMAPLVFFPGAGSELYRGVGSVVVGGLIASTLFTLFVVPALFRLVYGARTRVVGSVAGDSPETGHESLAPAERRAGA